MRDSLSRFDLVTPLGQGGMGEVWLARDRTTGAAAALKRMRADLGPDDLARFAREAETLSRLDHPGVVRLLAWGLEGSSPWLAMEHLPGGTLHERVKRGGALEPREAVQVGIELARALVHVHAAGVVHRDVKSENLLRDAEGRIKLADFGLCRPVAPGGELTATGTILGTPAFASPEQLLGQVERVGPTTDVYGLGAVLYHLLTAHPPNRGETFVAVLESALEGATPPSELRPGLDPDLEEIVLRCLAPDPGERWVDAASVAGALEGWLATREGERAARRSRRLVGRVTLGLVGSALLLGAGIVVALTRRWEAPPAAPALEETLDRARQAVGRKEWARAGEELDRAVALDPDSTSARLGRAQVRLELGDATGATEDARRATVLAPQDPFAWGVLAEVHRARRDFPACDAAVARALALDPG